MNLSSLLVFVVGMVWCMAGITVLTARRKNCSIPHFYFFGSLWAAFILGLFMVLSGDAAQLRFAQWPLIAMTAGGAVVNGLGQATIMWNMKSAGCALPYTIPQLGFIIPFLAAGLFWGEKITWMNLTGVFLEACAILAVFPKQNGTAENSREFRRILIALGAFLMLGISQLFYIYPSLPRNAALKLPESASAFFTLFTNALSFMIILLTGKKTCPVSWKVQLPFSFAWGTVAATAFFILFMTFRLMGEKGQAGLVYPVASSVEIILFTLFTRFALKEKLTWKQIVALAVIVIGIFMVKLQT